MLVPGHGARVPPLELAPGHGHGAQISARVPTKGYVQTGAVPGHRALAPSLNSLEDVHTIIILCRHPSLLLYYIFIVTYSPGIFDA